MAVSVTHNTPADGTFSTEGKRAWEEAHTLTQDAAGILGATGAGATGTLTAAEVRTAAELGNVENTALSTWTGSGTVTAIGALVSGTVPLSLTTGILPKAQGGAGANNASAGAGTFLRGDGSNFVTSTLTLPNALTSGAVLYGSAANVAATSAVLGATQVVLGGGAGAAPNASAALTFSGTALNVSVDQNGFTGITASNATAGTAALIGVSAVSSGGANSTAIYNAPSTYTGIPEYAGNGVLATNVTGGGVQHLLLVSGDTNGEVRIYSGGRALSNRRVVINSIGNTGFGGNTSPTAKIHPAAGTATANTSPLKLTSGPLLTSVTGEAGAEEFLTDDRSFIISTGPTRKIYAWTPAQTDVTASRALDTTYTAPATRSIMVMATVRCAVTLAGGTADVQAKSDSSTPPTTVASGLIGIQAGLLGEDNSFQISFVVGAGMKYRIDSATTNGTVTKGLWFEIAF